MWNETLQKIKEEREGFRGTQMSAISINGLAPVKKAKRIKRWIGFWLLKDIPKAKVIIRNGNFIVDANTTAIEVKNANPFIETTITSCNFYPDDYKVVRKVVKKTLWQKIMYKVRG